MFLTFIQNKGLDISLFLINLKINSHQTLQYYHFMTLTCILLPIDFVILLSPDVSRRGLLKWVCPSIRPRLHPSVPRHIEMGSLWTQLLLRFLNARLKNMTYYVMPLGARPSIPL